MPLTKVTPANLHQTVKTMVTTMVNETAVDSADVVTLINANAIDSADATLIINSNIAAKSTSDLSEGSNLYYTNARADARIAAATTSDLSEGTNKYYTTSRGDSDTGAYIAGNRTYGNITTTGYIAGPATMTIDPAAVGDNTGTLVIAGNLQVDGTTTTINSTTMEVDDLNLTLASGAANAAAASGAGITVQGASAQLTYDAIQDRWNMNKGLELLSSPLVVGTGTTDVGRVETSAGVFSLYAYTGRQIAFGNDTNGEHVRIDADGNVGIGTINPGAKLDVKGNFTLRDTTGNLSHGMSVFGDNDQYAIFNQEVSGDGGLRITTLSDASSAASAFQLNAVATTPSTDGNNAAIRLRAAKKNGTTEQALASTEDVLSIGNTGTELVIVKGNGNAIFLKNLSVGDSTLSTYHTNYPAVELGASGSVQGYTGNNGAWLQSNLFMNTNGHWTSKSDDYSAMLELYDGNFNFYNTASGTGTRTLLTPMTIRQNGNVGIGSTTSPGAKLTITDENAGQPMLQVRNYSTAATGGFGNAHSVELRSATSTTTHGALIHHHENNIGRRTLDVSDANGIFASFVQGKVGIGTTEPSQKLEVAGYIEADGYFGDGGATSNITFSQATSTSNPSVALWGRDHSSYPGQVHIVGRNSNSNTSSGDIRLWNYNGSTWYNMFRFAYDTDNSDTRTTLQTITDTNTAIVSTQSIYNIIDSNNNQSDRAFFVSCNSDRPGNATTIIRAGEDRNIVFGQNYAAGMYNGTGSNGFGVQQAGLGGQYVVVQNTADSNIYLSKHSSYTDSRVLQFGIGGTTKGSVTITSAGTTYNTTSDLRLKTDIKPIDDATDKLLSMKPVQHKWKANPEDNAVHGFIAQEMKEIIPEAVYGDPEGDEMMSMDYGRITPVIVAALQDALKEIKELKTRINELEAK